MKGTGLAILAVVATARVMWPGAAAAEPTPPPAAPVPLFEESPPAVPAVPAVEESPPAVPAVPALEESLPAVPAVPAVEAAPPAVPAVPAVEAAPPQPLFDLGWDSGKPLSIRSDELEYVQGAGSRRLLFRNHVSVEQDGMTIHSARLEAFYPPDGNQPDRLVAEGDVRLAKGERMARCERAVYERKREILTCEGGAELRQGESRLSGDVIEIDLASDRVRVRGGASVMLESGLAARDEEAQP